MAKEENLNKRNYKIVLCLLKFMPMILALSYFLNTILTYFGYNTEVFSNMCGISFIPWLFIYLSSIVFRFCNYHKMFLHYVLVINILDIIDYYFHIPVSDYEYLVGVISITGIFMFIILYLYVKHHKENVSQRP